MPKQIIHIDSLNSELLSNNPSNYYNCRFNNIGNFKNVTNVKLLSLEMPIAFNCFRKNSNATLSFRINGNIINWTIPDSNLAKPFNNIQELVVILPTVLPGGFLFAWGVSIFDTINVTTNTTNWNFISTPLLTALGIVPSPTMLSSGMYEGIGKYNLNADNFISLYIPEIGTNSNNSKISFKIPLTVGPGQILYVTENIYYSQSVNCNISNLNNLTCQFYDRYGNEIQSLSNPWSGTFEIEYND